jgi:hypothetical protein
MSEHDEQVELFRWKQEMTPLIPELEWLHAIPNGGRRSTFVARKMKAEGTTPGIFDVFLPVASGGYHGFYLEMKFGKNKMSQHQTRFQRFVDGNGFKTGVFYSWQEAARGLLEYLPDRLLIKAPYAGMMSHDIDPENYVLLEWNLDANLLD